MPDFDVTDNGDYWVVVFRSQSKRFKFRQPSQSDPKILYDIGYTPKGKIVPARIYYPKAHYTQEQVEEKRDFLQKAYEKCPTCAHVKQELEDRKQKGTVVKGIRKARDREGEPMRTARGRPILEEYPSHYVSGPRTEQEWEVRKKSPIPIVEEVPVTVEHPEGKRLFIPFDLLTKVRRKYRKEIARYKRPWTKKEFIEEKALEEARVSIQDRIEDDTGIPSPKTVGLAMTDLVREAMGELPIPPRKREDKDEE